MSIELQCVYELYKDSNIICESEIERWEKDIKSYSESTNCKQSYLELQRRRISNIKKYYAHSSAMINELIKKIDFVNAEKSRLKADLKGYEKLKTLCHSRGIDVELIHYINHSDNRYFPM
jgi:chromosome segregation ATPase